MEFRRQHSIILAIVLIAVNFLLGCAPKGKGPGVNTKAGAPAGQSGGGTTTPKRDSQGTFDSGGTSDSGGGTGINDKVFESYIVDPLQLPAYKQHLESLLANIQSGKADDPSEYHQMFKVKTWYIAPVKLENINKDVLGVSFIQSATQQIARQTSKSVWIDKAIYEKMSSRDQAELLLHELVMNMYLFKFMSIKEMCRISLIIHGEKNNEGCVGDVEMLDRYMPAEPVRPLNEEDNENIRFVTGWLLMNAQKPIAEQDFVKVLASKNFDKRMFNPENYGENPQKEEELKISRKEIFRAIKGSELTGTMPSVCSGVNSGQTKPCKIEVSERVFAPEINRLPGFDIRVAVDGKTIEFSPLVADETSLIILKDTSGGTIYSIGLVEVRDKVRIGDRFYSGYLFFKKDGSDPHAALALESVILKPGIVISIDKKRDPICLVREPGVERLSDDTLIIRRKNAKAHTIEQVYSATRPYAVCTPENIEE